jgi:hypothetical protein
VGAGEKVTTMVWAPSEALEGMAKVACAVPVLGREMEVPEMVPARVMLVGTFPEGGCGGEVGSVMVIVTVVP